MGIGALRLTVSYLKYIFVDGTFIDVAEDTWRSRRRDNISPVRRKEASFPVASPMKKPASQSQPPRPASAYGLLTACFMPLYTWLDVYGHRIPTDRFLHPPPSFFKSSGRFYESCDLIDRTVSSAPYLRPPHLLHLLCLPRSAPHGSYPFSSSSFARAPFQSRRSSIRQRYASASPPICGFGLRFNYKPHPPAKAAFSKSTGFSQNISNAVTFTWTVRRAVATLSGSRALSAGCWRP